MIDPSGLCGVWPPGALADCLNPFSSGNLAYQAVSKGAGAIGVDWDRAVASLAENAPLVDLTALVTCVTPGLDVACIPALDAAFAASTAHVAQEGIMTNWGDPGHLFAEQLINTLFYGVGSLVKYGADASDLSRFVKVALMAPAAVLQGAVDYLQVNYALSHPTGVQAYPSTDPAPASTC